MQQRNVPGIDCAFLAMDNEEGVEVVWNEVRISEKKSSKVQLVGSVVCFYGSVMDILCGLVRRSNGRLRLGWKQYMGEYNAPWWSNREMLLGEDGVVCLDDVQLS